MCEQTFAFRSIIDTRRKTGTHRVEEEEEEDGEVKRADTRVCQWGVRCLLLMTRREKSHLSAMEPFSNVLALICRSSFIDDKSFFTIACELMFLFENAKAEHPLAASCEQNGGQVEGERKIIVYFDCHRRKRREKKTHCPEKEQSINDCHQECSKKRVDRLCIDDDDVAGRDGYCMDSMFCRSLFDSVYWKEIASGLVERERRFSLCVSIYLHFIGPMEKSSSRLAVSSWKRSGWCGSCSFK